LRLRKRNPPLFFPAKFFEKASYITLIDVLLAFYRQLLGKRVPQNPESERLDDAALEVAFFFQAQYYVGLSGHADENNVKIV
jgi:hypothetical protein